MLKYTIKTPSEIGAGARNAMFALMSEHFLNLERGRFETDLNAKSGAILLESDNGTLRGFSTFLIYRDEALSAQVIFSGDTIIHQDSWGHPTLFYGFGQLLRRMIDNRAKGEKAYWFLISKGFRTYAMLPLFFENFWPAAQPSEDSLALRPLLDTVATNRFGEQYSAQTGLIAAGHDFLNEKLAQIPDHKTDNPAVRFFLERNPDYQTGTELACLTEISVENILPPARRFIGLRK